MSLPLVLNPYKQAEALFEQVTPEQGVFVAELCGNLFDAEAALIAAYPKWMGKRPRSIQTQAAAILALPHVVLRIADLHAEVGAEVAPDLTVVGIPIGRQVPALVEERAKAMIRLTGVRPGYTISVPAELASTDPSQDEAQQSLRLVDLSIPGVRKYSKQWVLRLAELNIARSLQAQPVLDDRGNETGMYTFDGKTVNASLTLIAKLEGLLIERKQIEVSVTDLSDDELKRRRDELRRALAAEGVVDVPFTERMVTPSNNPASQAKITQDSGASSRP